MHIPSPETIHIANWVPCTQAEGPGVRFALWVQGCPLRCPGCCNPEMFSDVAQQSYSIPDFFQKILLAKKEHTIEGVTFLGGEPFAQAKACAELALLCQKEGLSVMVFSGYTWSELKQQGEGAQSFLRSVDILVDGRYEKELHTEKRRWIGSTNQKVHFLTERYQEEDPQWKQPNTIDIHFDGKELFITGFPEGPWKEILQKWNARQKAKSRKKAKAHQKDKST